MRQTISAYLNIVIQVILLVVVAFTPLLFSSFTTDFIEIPKIIFLAIATLALLLLWTLSWVVEGRVLITRTPFDIPLLLFVGIVIASTLFAEPRYVSIWGNFPKIHGSVITWVIYALLYFIAVSNIKSQLHIKSMVYAFLFSSSVLAIVSLLYYFNLYVLPFDYAKTTLFNPAGTPFSASALLVLSLPLLILSVIRGGKLINTAAALSLLTLFLVTIALIGTLPTYVATAVALLIPFFVYKKSAVKKSLGLLVLPVVIGLVLAGLSSLDGGKINPLAKFEENYPKELQLPFRPSWDVAGKSFVENPFVGTGPSTYLFNYSAFKPFSINNTNLWNTRFDTAFNEYLQVLGTLGGVGFISFLFLTIVILGFAWKALKYNDQLGSDYHENIIPSALALSAILAIVLLLLHASTVVTTVATIFILALLAASHKSTNKVEEISLGIKASRLRDQNLIIGDMLPIIVFGIVFILVIAGAWKTRTVVLADYYHRLGIKAAASNQPLNYDCINSSVPTPPLNGIVTYNCLVKAAELNPYIDIYRTNLAQTNFALANNLATAKGPTESSPSGSLTDKDKTEIQKLLSQAINEARAATVLSPRNSQNWEILASIYRQISGVADNAIAFALDSYGRAIATDPFNPILRLNVGGVYYSVQNYDLAIRFFSDAIQLKPDFANGYYNLSVALRDRGDLQNSQAAAEKVLSLLDPKSPDYKVASDYLSDLKARISTGSAQESAIKAPAAEEKSALEKKETAPKVELEQLKNTPEKISTPAAIEK